ncbi:MAG: transketolase [Candidatus Aminicenantes bacterium]|nr:transketolase [Candidatus Aminicenantes bacterium]
MSTNNSSLEQLCINAVRTLAMDAVQQANSGHPGAAMALAPVAFIVYDRFMKFNPLNPEWQNRDRFVLSAGHASMLLYGVLHIMGYDVTMDDIKNFRQLHSRCPGHPEFGLTPGVETTTGPLGQGAANSVGMAIAEKWLGNYFNKPGYQLIDYNIFALAGDGCLMEGLTSEAASLAGHLGLDNLVWLYDNNHITIEGKTDLAFSEDVGARFAATGWNVERVSDANNLAMLDNALKAAGKKNGRPSLVIVDSHIAYGAPTKQDTASAHGSPLGEEEIRTAKKLYGWDPEKKFFVPDEVSEHSRQIMTRGKNQNQEWDKLLAQYARAYPELAEQLKLIQKNELPTGWDRGFPEFAAASMISGRAASGKVLNAIAEQVPFMVGGSADLAPSTLTLIKSSPSFQKGNYGGRNLHYGIREHAMGAVANGISLSGLRTFASTFFVFSDYARPAIRLSALMRLPVIYIFTHDSIGVGEDGPTHQPIEQLASLRAMPNLEVVRPADANEVAVAWKYIMAAKGTPFALVLSRQDLPVFDRSHYAPAEGVLRGGYILAGCDGTPDIIFIASGSEVKLVVDAHEELKKESIKSRVISMPNWSLYARQSPEYRETVLPAGVKARIAVEAASPFGWSEFIGLPGDGHMLGMDTFGASAKPESLYNEFGFTVDALVGAAKSSIKNHQT